MADNFFGIDPDNRTVISTGLRSTGYIADTAGSKSVQDKDLNTLLFKTQVDQIWGTETQTKDIEPTATFYTDGSGNALDKNDAAVVFVDDDRVAMAHDAVLTADLVIDGQSKRLDIFTARGNILLLDSTYKVELNNADSSSLNINTDGTVDDSYTDNTSDSRVVVNSIFLGPLLVEKGGNKNIIVESINDSELNFTADELELFDSKGRPKTIKNISFSIDLSITGAGGRAFSDGGGFEQSDTVYYIYPYCDYLGDYNGIASSESEWENITLSDKPIGSNYTLMASFAANDASSNIVGFKQRNNIYNYKNALTMQGSGAPFTNLLNGLKINTTVLAGTGNFNLENFLCVNKYFSQCQINLYATSVNELGPQSIAVELYNDADDKEHLGMSSRVDPSSYNPFFFPRCLVTFYQDLILNYHVGASADYDRRDITLKKVILDIF